MFGPCKRTLQRISAKQSTATFLDESYASLCTSLEQYVQIDGVVLSPDTLPGLSNSKQKNVIFVCIDATAVASKLQLDMKHGAIIGGCFPDTFNSIHDLSKDQITHLIKNDPVKMAEELKVAVVTQQQSIPGFPRHLILTGRAQTKNARSNFNSNVVDALIEYTKENDFVELGGVDVDGVSCDNEFVFETMLKFLKGKCNHIAMFDTNHNAKNLRYVYYDNMLYQLNVSMNKTSLNQLKI